MLLAERVKRLILRQFGLRTASPWNTVTMPPVQFTASLDNSLTDPRGYRALLSRLGRRQLPVLLLACAGIAAHPARGGTFEQDVAPILARSCAQCHSGENQASGFSVASLDAVFKGGARRGAAVIAGHPERSPLIQVLTGAVEPRMPLGGSLGPGEIDAISSWIRTLETHPTQQTQGGRDWFLTPVQSPQAPDVKDKTWPRTAIDAFVLAELEAKGLSPAPPAPARTLVRRIHLDLVGLPPSADEMRQFLEDRLPGAYERLVERLLADPRYGERWARHWLDLVRYGETGGLEGDGAIGNAWRYRDWVIEALERGHALRRSSLRSMQIAGARRTQQNPTTTMCPMQSGTSSQRVSCDWRPGTARTLWPLRCVRTISMKWRMPPPRCLLASRWAAPAVTTTSTIRFRCEGLLSVSGILQRHSGRRTGSQRCFSGQRCPTKIEAFAQKAQKRRSSRIRRNELENGAEKCGPSRTWKNRLRKKLDPRFAAMREAEGQGSGKAEDLRLEMRREDGQRIFS